jgi:hypothetical protein
LSRIPSLMKFCKTPIPGLFGFPNACLSGVLGLIKSLYLALQLFGLVGTTFYFQRDRPGRVDEKCR